MACNEMYKFNGEIYTEKMIINGFNVIYSQIPIGPHYSGLALSSDVLNGKVQMVQTSTCCAGCNLLKSINLEKEGKTKMISKYVLAAKTHTIQKRAWSVTLH